jgi:hypothetical protein
VSTLSRPIGETAEERSVLLTAVADTALTEIRLFDGAFREQARATGRLEVGVRPGLYKIAFLAGDGYEQQFVVVEEDDQGKHVSGPSVRFSSASPLSNTTAFRSDHAEFMGLVETELRRGVVAGSTAAVVYVRTAQLDGQQHELPRGLTLSIDGNLVENEVRSDPSSTIRGLIQTSLQPGPHTLTIAVGDKSDSRTVFTPPGVHTRVTFLLAPAPSSNVSRWEVSDVSLHYQQKPFDPSDSVLRLVDIGRQRMASGRPFDSSVRFATLWPTDSRLQDAMLLIFGAHLQPNDTPGSLADGDWCMSALNSIMPDNPDVVALRFARTSRDESTKNNVDSLSRLLHVNDVPSLAASWRTIVERSADDPFVVPAGSAAAIAAQHLRAANGWLHWKTSDIARPAEHRFVDLYSVDLEQLLREIARLVLRGASGMAAAANDPAFAEERLIRVQTDARLTPNEALFAGFAVWAAMTATALSKAELREWETPVTLRRRMVSSMNLPLVTIGSLVVPLRNKLRRLARSKQE